MTSSIFLRKLPFNCISIVVAIASLTIHAYPQPTIADNSDVYLRELEAEARSSANVQAPPKENAGNDTESNADNNIFNIFSNILKNERPMTFRFFVKLDKQQQQSIVEEFTKHKKISRASKDIFDLYFAKK